MVWRLAIRVHATQDAARVKSSLEDNLLKGDGVETFAPRDLQWIRLKEGRNGAGDLGFKSVQIRPTWWEWRFICYRPEPKFDDVGFFGISNAREVERLLRDTFHQTESR